MWPVLCPPLDWQVLAGRAIQTRNIVRTQASAQRCCIPATCARKVLAERFNGELDADGSRVSYETRILTREGDRRHVEVTVGMLQVEGKLTALVSAVDLTSQREVPSHRIVSSSVHNGDEIGSDISIEKLRGCPARDAQFLRVVQANAL
jgi:hypothetical protein